MRHMDYLGYGRAMPSTQTPVDTRLGPVLRQARKGAGVSIRALARQAGVDHSHVARFEKGERPISEAMYQHLLHALGTLTEKETAA